MADEEKKVVGLLTAEEIFELDNIAAMRNAADHALEVAMNFHMNRRSLLEQDINLFWDKITNRLWIPKPSPEKSYAVERRNGAMSVVEANPKDVEFKINP